MKSPLFQRKQVYPFLGGIEALAEAPYNMPDIASVRRFHPNLESSTLDTSSFILWKKDKKFKVTNNFPWDEVTPRYLGNSLLGKNSILEILPDFYDGVVEEEFELINPSDDPSELYALSSKHTFLEKKYTIKELEYLKAGVLGRRITKREAYVHPLWLALFNRDVNDLELMVNWVWEHKEKNERLMGIYVTDPGKLCAFTWKSKGLIDDCNALATTGFNHEKKFLTASLTQGKS